MTTPAPPVVAADRSAPRPGDAGPAQGRGDGTAATHLPTNAGRAAGMGPASPGVSGGPAGGRPDTPRAGRHRPSPVGTAPRTRLLQAAARQLRGLAAALLLGAALAPAAMAQSGDTRALWEQAVGLVQAGEPERAIPILERLVTAMPDAAPVRLELGLAYFLTGTDDKARFHISRALAGTLSENEEAGARAMLARIEARRPWSFAVGFALVPQTNVGRRTSTQTVTIGGLPFVLNDTSSAGVGASVSARFAYLPRLGPDLRGRFLLSLGGSVYPESLLNDYTLRAEAGLLRRFGNREVGLGLTAAQRWLAERRYTHEAGIYGSLALRPDPGRQVALRLDLVDRRSTRRPGLEGRVMRLSLGAEQVLSPRLAVHGRAFATLTDVAAPQESGRLAGVTLGSSYQFDGGWRTALEVTASRDLRDGPNPLFAVTRRDTELRVVARLLNREVQLRGYAPVLELGHERRRSSLPIASFTNTYLSVGLDRAF